MVILVPCPGSLAISIVPPWSSMIFLGDGKPESRPDVLGRKIGLEDPVQDILLDPDARVFDLKAKQSSVRGEPNADFALAADGFDGVGQKVAQGDFQLGPVALKPKSAPSNDSWNRIRSASRFL